MRPVIIPPPDPPLVCLDPATNTGVTPPRLLTRVEYDYTVRDLLALTSTDTLEPSLGFPAENRVLGFDNNATSHVANPLLVSTMIDAAERISNHLLETGLSRVVPCTPQQVGTSTCGHQFVDKLLPRAFRRTVKPEETASVHAFFDASLATDGFENAVLMTLQLVLQSPQFMYRLEPGNTGIQGAQVVPLNDEELASRLSYFLWASMPDDELLRVAARGELQDSATYEAQVRRMMSDPKARRTTEHFHRLWLEIERLDTVVKDTRVYPEWNEALRASWTGSLNAFVDDAVWGDVGTLQGFLTDPSIWVDARLAQLYGLPAPSGNGFKKVAMDPAAYSGLLTQPGLMAALSLPNQTSPIRRGVFVRERILCQNLPPPPANMAIVPPDPKPGATTRERFKEHTANEFCASCHQRIDPVGFGFENFDAMGRYRTMEQGKAVDASGELGYLRDHTLEGAFSGAHALAEKLVTNPEVNDCVAREWFRYAIGRDATTEDTCSLVNVQTAFSQSGGKFRELILALTQTDAFRYRVADQEAP